MHKSNDSPARAANGDGQTVDLRPYLDLPALPFVPAVAATFGPPAAILIGFVLSEYCAGHSFAFGETPAVLAVETTAQALQEETQLGGGALWSAINRLSNAGVLTFRAEAGSGSLALRLDVGRMLGYVVAEGNGQEPGS